MIAKRTAVDLKQANRNAIYQFLWTQGLASKQMIMRELNLSLPTVTQNLNQLAAEGLVRENGVFGYTGGRSAVGYSIVPEARFAVGVDINGTHIAAVVADLNGDILESVHDHCRFENTPAYFGRVAQHVEHLLQRAGVEEKRLLGVGFSMQGLVSQDHRQVTYGPVLGTTGIRLEQVAQAIPYPSQLFHDADSAAFAELWVSRELVDAVYISLSTNLGGSIIRNRAIFNGDNFMAGKLEHMTLVPGGGTCYCGKKGCAEVYCRASLLSEITPDNRLETYFTMLKEGQPAAVERWDDYMEHLSILLNNLHMLLDVDVILGGYMAVYIEPWLEELKRRTYQRNSVDISQDYIKLAQARREAVATGAALYYIDSFIQSI